jgi:hypothetical protein
MEFLFEYSPSEQSTPNSAQSSVDDEQANGRTFPSTEPESFSSPLEDRLGSDEAFLRPTPENLEQRRVEAGQLHHAYDEKNRLAALESDRSQADHQTQQRSEREQKLLADIDALREAEAQQRQLIEEATAATRRRSAEENRKDADFERVVSRDVEEEKMLLARLEFLQAAAESEADARAAEKERLQAEIQAISQVTSEQIDRMEQAKARLAILEELRVHAETKVCERAEREIRLEAEIEALRQIEASQDESIEAAEAELRRLTVEQNRAQASAEAERKAASEARRLATIEAAQQAADEALRVAEEKDRELEHLETIRARAEAAAQERAQKESLLNSQLLAFGETAAEQLKRIERAEADLSRAGEELLRIEEEARQKSEELAHRLAETEGRRQSTARELAQAEADAQGILNEDEQRLVVLESLRREIEASSKRRQEEEQRLLSEIEALRQVEAEQLNSIADAELALQERKEELQAAADSARPEHVERQIEPWVAPAAEPESSLNDLQSVQPNSETATRWSKFEPDDQTSQTGGQFAEEVESRSDDRVQSASTDCKSVSEEAETKGSAKANDDSVAPEKPVNAATYETLLVSSLAERLRSGSAEQSANAKEDLARLDDNTAFSLITALFDDASEEVRNGAARALYDRSTERADHFTRALREASPERRRQIVTALESSGLAAEAIDSLAGESREKTHDSFSMLFLMAKAGEVQSLVQAIEKHPNIQVRLSVIKLFTFTNRPDMIPALRSLAVRGALPIEVRSALMKSIYEMSSGTRERSLSAA